MKKKIAYMLIGALCSITLTYGFVAFADQLETPSTVKDPTVVSETAKQQIAKANEVSITLIPSPSQSHANEVSITLIPSPSQSHSTNTLKTIEESFKLDQMRKLEIKINQNGLKVKIKLKRENAKIDSEVEIEKIGDHNSHLEGSEADQYIQQLLGSIGLNKTMSKQEFADALLKKFDIDPGQAEIKVKLKWNNQSSELEYEQDDKDKEDQKFQKVRKKHKDQIDRDDRDDRDDGDHHGGNYKNEHDDHDHNNHNDGDEEE
ncbi:YusW family protein [Cohnella luojiensis]|nr:YusW family protein [Cohnella luojiensis]